MGQTRPAALPTGAWRAFLYAGNRMVIRCRDCGHFVARLSCRARVIGTVKHSDRADDAHDVVPCSSCGTLHEVQRIKEAA